MKLNCFLHKGGANLRHKGKIGRGHDLRLGRGGGHDPFSGSMHIL